MQLCVCVWGGSESHSKDHNSGGENISTFLLRTSVAQQSLHKHRFPLGAGRLFLHFSDPDSELNLKPTPQTTRKEGVDRRNPLLRSKAASEATWQTQLHRS